MILAPEGSFIHDVSICTTLPLPLILMLYRGIFQYQNAGFVQNNIDREEDTDILLINWLELFWLYVIRDYSEAEYILHNRQYIV